MSRVLLAVRGSIAAYKCPDLVSRLVKLGHSVDVMLSEAAEAFVAPLALAAMSGQAVFRERDFLAPAGGVPHVSLQREHDILLLAPLTAKGLSDMASGRAGDFISAVYLGFRGPVIAAPAMETDMWEHPATARNLECVRRDGVIVVPPATGRLASGAEGVGRMAEPEDIVFEVGAAAATKDLRGLRLVVSAGPTREFLDPVRFLSNPSTGRMGIALAERAAQRGADVHLLLGPTSLRPAGRLAVERVVSAEEMFDALRRLWPEADAFIAAAAVSDQRPQRAFSEKRRKEELGAAIETEKTPDLLAWAGENKERRILIGFAAETDPDPVPAARRKLEAKGLSLIAVNRIGEPGAGFEAATNHLILLDASGVVGDVRGTKDEVAGAVLDRLAACARP